LKNRYIHYAHISEGKFRAVLKLFCADVPALTSAGLTGLSVQATQRLYDKLRLRILELAVEEARPFAGEVEVDESYFGARRVRGKRGRGASGKTPVIGLLKRGGKVFTAIVENCSRQELMPIVKGQVLSQSTVYTDGWKSYDGLVLGGYKHHRIHHHQNQFARGKNHVNGIESFWSFTKLRLAKLRGIRHEYFILHLKESEWRFNHRHDNLYRLLLKILRSHPL
jgi:transposase-like protein